MTDSVMIDCPECQDLLVPYALGALDAREHECVRAHLRSGCDACAAELRGVEATLARLPLMLDPVAPPTELRERLMEKVAHDGRTTTQRVGRQAAPAIATSAPRRPRWRWLEPLVAGGLAAAITAGLLWARIDRQQREIADLRDAIDRQQARVDELRAGLDAQGDALRLYASPAVQLVTLAGTPDQPAAKARVLWDQDRGRYHLFASGLRPLPPGKAYELWFINAEQKKIPAGTFAANARGEASIVASPPADAGRIAALAVTDEPAAGAPQPTGHIQLLGKPS